MLVKYCYCSYPGNWLAEMICLPVLHTKSCIFLFPPIRPKPPGQKHFCSLE